MSIMQHLGGQTKSIMVFSEVTYSQMPDNTVQKDLQNKHSDWSAIKESLRWSIKLS